MKRVMILLLVAGATLFASQHIPEAQAHRYGFGRYYGGYGRYFGGYRGFGYGYSPRFSIGIGYGGFGGYGGYYGSYYRPFYGGYYRSYYPSYYRAYYPAYYPSYYSYPGYGGYGYGCASNAPRTYINNTYVAAPPVYADPSVAYGPGAVKEFMGVGRDFATGPLVATRPVIVDAAPADGRRIVAAPEAARPAVASNAEARALAARFISFGDGQFGEQQYHSAAQRYREAIGAAPDVADAHFRQGFAYAASKRSDLAVKAFRRGLALDPLWVNSSFRIDDLYEGNRLAKNAHIEALAKAALENRAHADNFFLLGVLLHFDGQQERAVKFFKEAERLSGEDAGHIAAFLVPPAPAVDDAV